jgi:hypothetical protein
VSFTLVVFHAPGVRTIAQAEAFIGSRPAASDDHTVRFEAFRDDILRVYPDNSDADVDDVDNAWPEGWSHPLGREAALAFAVDTDHVDDNLMRHLGHAAARAGLHLLDRQEGRLYRSDATTIDLHGHEQALGAPQPPRALQRLDQALTEDAVGRHITAAFVARHPGLGFEARQANGFAELERTRSGVTQRIAFFVSRRTEEAMVGVSMAFSCPRLGESWARLLGERVQAYWLQRQALPRPRPDLTLHTDDFAQPASPLATELGRRQYARMRSWAEVDAYVERFDAWFVREGAAAFEALTTPAAFAHLALTDHQLEWLFLANDLFIDEMLARLLLVGVFDAQRLDAWMKGLRDHRQRQGGRRRVAGFVPDENAALEALAGLIGSDAFAAEAARLSADAAPAPASSPAIELALWEHPVGRGWPRDWTAAMAWLDQQRAAARTTTLPLDALLAELSPRHAGVALRDGDKTVPTLSVPASARAAAMATARAFGLSSADVAGGLVHYANGFEVTPERNKHHHLPDAAFEDPASPHYRLQPTGDLLPLPGLLDLACLRLERFLRRHGFARWTADAPPPQAPGEPPARFLWRTWRRRQGAGWSELKMHLHTRGAIVELSVDCAACLSEAAVLFKRFHVSRGGKDDGEEHSTAFARQHHWMTDPQGLLGTDDGSYHLARMDDLDVALAHLSAQLESRLLPVLAAFDSASGVDALLNAGPAPTSVFFEGLYEFAETQLVAARVARNPRFEALCALYIERATVERAGHRKNLFGDRVKFLTELAAYLRTH